MSVDVVTEQLIGQPVDVVSGYAADPTNAPEWYVNIESVEWETAPPAAVGSRVAFVARFLGRSLRYTYELVEWVPGERLVMRTAQGSFPMETTYAWEATSDGGTRMTPRNRGEPARFSKLVARSLLWRCVEPTGRTSPLWRGCSGVGRDAMTFAAIARTRRTAPAA